MKERTVVKVVLSVSMLLGVLFAVLFHIHRVIDSILVSLIAGVLLYIIVREFLPHREKGQPAFFVVGLCVFSLVNFIVFGTNG